MNAPQSVQPPGNAADERAAVNAAAKPSADGEQPCDSGPVALEVGPGTGDTHGFADERMQLNRHSSTVRLRLRRRLRTGLGA